MIHKKYHKGTLCGQDGDRLTREIKRVTCEACRKIVKDRRAMWELGEYGKLNDPPEAVERVCLKCGAVFTAPNRFTRLCCKTEPELDWNERTG